MSGPWKDRHIDRTIALFPGDLYLANSPILVAGALQDGNRDPYVGETAGDVPAAKFRVEPGAVPAVEGVVDIAVPALEFGAEVRGLVGLLDRGDRPHRNILHDKMRRDHRNRAHAVVLNAAGIDRGDRGAIGMPKQQATAKADPVEHFRQDIEGFDVHVLERPR